MVNGLGGRRPFKDAQRLDWPFSDKVLAVRTSIR